MTLAVVPTSCNQSADPQVNCWRQRSRGGKKRQVEMGFISIWIGDRLLLLQPFFAPSGGEGIPFNWDSSPSAAQNLAPKKERKALLFFPLDSIRQEMRGLAFSQNVDLKSRDPHCPPYSIYVLTVAATTGERVAAVYCRRRPRLCGRRRGGGERRAIYGSRSSLFGRLDNGRCKAGNARQRGKRHVGYKGIPDLPLVDATFCRKRIP